MSCFKDASIIAAAIRWPDREMAIAMRVASNLQIIGIMNTQPTHILHTSMPAQSQILAGRYRLEGLIGRGNMAEVYRAFDLVRGAYCAVKVLLRNYALQEDVKRRFLREAAIISRLNHPNIVALHDLCITEDGTPVLAMELLQGEDLSVFLKRRGTVPLPEALYIIAQVVDGLVTLHRHGILHRDIKPQNIFLCDAGRSNRGPVVKLIDLGLAKLLIPTERSTASEHMLIGTPEYLAPEATTGRPGDVDARVDQWALAVLLYRMLSGRLPFPITSGVHELLHRIRTQPPIPIEVFAKGVPPQIAMAVRKALQRDRNRRFSSIQEFLTALRLEPASARNHEAPTILTSGPSHTSATLQLSSSATERRAPVRISPNRRIMIATLIGAPLSLLLLAGLLRAREHSRRPSPVTYERSAHQELPVVTKQYSEMQPPPWIAPVNPSAPPQGLSSSDEEPRQQPVKSSRRAKRSRVRITGRSHHR